MGKLRMPPDDIMETAIMWLEMNEGDNGNACRIVAEWLEQERNERMIRQAARKGGVKVARLRRSLDDLVNASPDDLNDAASEVWQRARAALKS